MKWLGLLLALCIGTAQAQSIPFPGPGGVVSAATYTGPGNVVSGATAWYGLRAYSTATRGNRAINLCDNTGANCADISTNATTGKLNAPGTLGANNCNTSGTCQIHTWYDQTGGTACGGTCDATATSVVAPTLNFNCINSLPCAVFNGTNSQLATSTGLASFSTATVSTVSIRTGNFTTGGALMTFGAIASPGTLLNYRQAANAVQMYAQTSGQFISNITDNNYHAFQAVYNGASSVLMCGGSAGTACSTSGTSNSISPGSTASGVGPICIGVENVSTACTGSVVPLTGQIAEIGLWGATVFTGTQQTNMNSNQYSFWGPF